MRKVLFVRAALLVLAITMLVIAPAQWAASALRILRGVSPPGVRVGAGGAAEALVPALPN